MIRPRWPGVGPGPRRWCHERAGRRYPGTIAPDAPPAPRSCRRCAPRHRVARCMAEPAFVLALGARPAGRTGLDPEPPVPGGGVKLRVHRDLTAGHVAARDRRTGIVEQNLGGHAAKSREGALRSPEPVLPAPAGKGPHMDAAWMRREPPGVATKNQTCRCAPPVPTRRCPKPVCNRRPGRVPKRTVAPSPGPQLPAQMRHRRFDRAQAHRDVLPGGKLMADRTGVARMATEPFPDPCLRAIRRLRSRRR